MSFFPEGDTSLVTDDEARSLKKWNQIWHDTYGNQVTAYPEGTQPLPSDDEQRTLVKLVALGRASGGEVIGDPVADFEGDVLSGEAPLAVTFTNLSIGDFTDWLWDFGDGSGSSSEENPVHEYAAAGVYTVTLEANGPDSDSEVKVDYIEVTAALTLVSDYDSNLEVTFDGSNKVSGWADQTANGNDLEETEAEDFPTRVPAQNEGCPAIRSNTNGFTGLNFFELSVALNEFTVHGLLHPEQGGVPVGDYDFLWVNVGEASDYHIGSTSGKWSVNGVAGTIDVDAAATIFTFVDNGTSFWLFIDGVQALTGASVAIPLSNYSIMNGGQDFYLLSVYSGAASTAQRESMEAATLAHTCI